MYEHCVDEGGHSRLGSLEDSCSRWKLCLLFIPVVSLVIAAWRLERIPQRLAREKGQVSLH